MRHVPVVVVGAGPAGLLLAQLLHAGGIDCVVLERRDRAYVEARIRAGVLERGTVELLRQAGVGERVAREGLVHTGFWLSVGGRRHHVDLAALTGGGAVTVYGQTEVVKDLIAARVALGQELVFEAADVAVEGFLEERAVVRWTDGGSPRAVSCDFVAGCDGFHGVCRASIPPERLVVRERVYPFAWLGILADAPPPSDELVYVRSDRGFALFSMRGPNVSRSYLQCRTDEDIAAWPDDRIWAELRRRLGDIDAALVHEGPVREKSITPMRSFVAEPLRHGRLLLAGDAAHIVPPTGAKGLNLAASDVHYLSRALLAHYHQGRDDLLETYSSTALARVWKAQRFSWWMTSMLHLGSDPFDDRLRVAELEYLLGSTAARTALAENYVGLPF
ncbi:MAG: 4-hydroxybenzoate 3-monooxygenase [Ectothiorhodospiraceae bacterium]|nr:4-hydroxybenzoate 3-monooxygenase [Chromatiales bacterium]MCP5156538.1 4-hydroxybenzoate 3-monooxygenase [Ectothiorhodospiraceae bacterium]